MPSISFNRETFSHFEDAIQKEWIITNGLGGYASSTALGINTRKYHGLLVATLHPPGDRRVLLSKLDEEISIGRNTYPLYSNEFQDRIHPQGYSFLKEFSVAPFPTYIYEVQDVEIQKTIFMPQRKNAAVILYKILNKNAADVKIRVFPLINWRHFHSITERGKISAEPACRQEGKEVRVKSIGPQSVLMMRATTGQFSNERKWIEKIYYREEANRGESCLDDCYQCGCFEIGVRAKENDSFAVAAVADEKEDIAHKIMMEMPLTVHDAVALCEREAERRTNLLSAFFGRHQDIPTEDWLKWIIFAADSFIVEGADPQHQFIIAGYHWFEAWGRDAFISLPGLMLVTGRFEEARRIFLTFQRHYKQDMIPNFIPDQAGPPAYNSVDATLWYTNAVLQYVKYTGDFEFVRNQIWENLKNSAESYAAGATFDIFMDDDGMISHGPQLTWMDATVDGQAVTPRAGKTVEVQALWYNALKTMELLARRFHEIDEAEKYLKRAELVRKNFAEKFWNADRNCLFDVVNDHVKDNSLRPNQIIAVALDFIMLDDAKNMKLVDTVQRELLTPFGLRTLARNDPRYVGVCSGDRRSRDNAYHNGTVWPWLLGPFATAFLKVKGYEESRREYVLRNCLLPLFTEQIFKRGLGTLSEIFDGESPQMPRGCIAQAWSVAEPLRAYVEDVMQFRPKHEREVLQGSK